VIHSALWRLRVLAKRLTLLLPFTTVIEYCRECGCRQPLVWTASDPLWAVVSGNGDLSGVLCPRCFDRRAVKAGLFLRWIPIVESTDVDWFESSR